MDPIRHRLEQPLSLGGSRADRLQVPGLPPGALRLDPAETGAVVESRVAGLHVAGKAVAPGARRLIRPGEHASLLEVELSVTPPPRPDGTRAAAAALLRNAAMGGAAPAGPMLVVLDGPAAGTPLPLAADQVIGRGRSARLRLADPATSRRHARLRLLSGGATVEDLGAKNGLRVNGVRVERGPVPLRPGDVLTVGETSLALELPEATAAATAGAPSPGRGTQAPRSPVAREPVAALVWAVLLAAAAVGLFAAACAV
jgi:hypothetical protein